MVFVKCQENLAGKWGGGCQANLPDGAMGKTIAKEVVHKLQSQAAVLLTD